MRMILAHIGNIRGVGGEVLVSAYLVFHTLNLWTKLKPVFLLRDVEASHQVSAGLGSMIARGR